MGALINFGLIIVGSFIGLLLKKVIKKDLTDMLMTGMGVSLIIIAIIGVIPTMLSITSENKITSNGTLLLIISIFVGSIIGYLLHISDRLDRFGTWLERKFKLESFSSSFVTSTLFFCVGAMAILGSIEEGINGDLSILIVKSVIDMIVAIVFASTLGYGVIFSAIPVLIYEGILILCGGLLQPVIATELGTNIINGVCMVGYVIILAVAINMLGIKKIKTGDLVPAMFIPIIYYLILSLF